MVANRPSVGDLRILPIGELASLPAEVLILLQEESDAALVAAKLGKERLDAALSFRYGERAAALRREQGKDSGLVRFDDGDVAVVADQPKKVEWAQDQLAALVERIRPGGEDPADYVELAFKVSERKYAAWPASIRAAFACARTVKPGKPSFRLTLRQETPS